jgi:hypothetical protein
MTEASEGGLVVVNDANMSSTGGNSDTHMSNITNTSSHTVDAENETQAPRFLVSPEAEAQKKKEKNQPGTIQEINAPISQPGQGHIQEMNSIQKSKTTHLQTLIYSIFVFIWLILLCLIPVYPFYEIYSYIWAPIVFVVFYFLYIGEALCCVCDCCLKCGYGSSTYRYVSNKMSDTAAENFLAKLMATAPIFVMHVECYHMETRTRIVSDGNGGMRTETYQVKVVTHTASARIRYGTWVDCSTKVTGLQSVQLMKMKLEKKFEYADEETYNAFERQRLQFRANNNFDECQARFLIKCHCIIIVLLLLMLQEYSYCLFLFFSCVP